MEEKPTTDEPVVDTGADEALPVDTTEDTADSSAAEENQHEDQGEDTAEEAQDSLPDKEDLRKYAKDRNMDVDDLSERELGLLKMAKDNQADYQRTRQKESQLEKSSQAAAEQAAEIRAEDTGQDPEILKTIARIETRQNVSDFWNTPLPNGQKPNRQLEPAMVQQLETKPHLVGDLESLYASAVFSSGAINSERSQGGKAALQKLAHNQQAAVPRGHATTHQAPKEKPFNELSIPEMEQRLGKVRY